MSPMPSKSEKEEKEVEKFKRQIEELKKQTQ